MSDGTNLKSVILIKQNKMSVEQLLGKNTDIIQIISHGTEQIKISLETFDQWIINFS